jgi:hypothetical protein
MLFQRVNRTDAEKVFTIVQNVSGGSVVAGNVVEYDSGTSADGIRVITPTTAGLSCFAGVATATIANNAYGLVQIYGYASALVINDVTTALVAGKILVPVNAQLYLDSKAAGIAAADGKSGFVYALETNATATAGAITTAARKVFIRAM